MVELTILTPIYNRENMIHTTYQSLLEQSNQQFKWLLIDDGSTDNTQEAVQYMIDNHHGHFEIEYHVKENGGKHTALNYAHPYIDTAFVMILDSDDALSEDSIATFYQEIESYDIAVEKIGWFAFLRGKSSHELLDTPYLKDHQLMDYIAYLNAGRQGECCDVYVSSVFKAYPYPEVEGEKFVSESYLNIRAAVFGHYNMVTINKILQVTEYLEGGLTDQGRLLQLRSPKGNAMLWQPVANAPFSLKMRIKGQLLYSVYLMFAQEKLSDIIRNSKNRLLTSILTPASYVLYLYWKRKYTE